MTDNNPTASQEAQTVDGHPSQLTGIAPDFEDPKVTLAKRQAEENATAAAKNQNPFLELERIKASDATPLEKQLAAVEANKKAKKIYHTEVDVNKARMEAKPPSNNFF
jgi:4-hydroxyphenylpyruvate dioxygenase-like putative hemolysin